jgi:hypothetical protein
LSKSGNNLVVQIDDSNLTLRDWYKGTAYQLSAVEFADSTVWSKADVNEIAAGTKEPFSTAPAPMSAMSAGFEEDAEIAEALALLSASPSPVGDDPGSYFPDEPNVDDQLTAAGETGWGNDPGLASLTDEPEIPASSDYDMAQQDVEMAVAGLGFGSEAEGVAGDTSGAAPSSYNPLPAATSADSSLGDCFIEEENRQGA